MHLYSPEKIRAWDAYTIEHEPIKAIDLMNRAAQTFTQWFVQQFMDSNIPVVVMAGTGNNGADGVAVARMLHYKFYNVRIYVCGNMAEASALFIAQTKLLPPRGDVPVTQLQDGVKFPIFPNQAIIIDALLGSGLNRTPVGQMAELIDYINLQTNPVVSIDVPSGLFIDKQTKGPCVQATRTFSFETPKIAYFFAENQPWVGDWHFGSIGLHAGFLPENPTPFHYVNDALISSWLRPRHKFDHKGKYGKALLIAGSKGMMGAAVLSATACLRAGVGVLTVRTPQCGLPILQTAVPEAICRADAALDFIADMQLSGDFHAIGLGCGLGMELETQEALIQFFKKTNAPLVLDADALNIIALHPDLLHRLPKYTVLTPHRREFERLFGKSSHDMALHERQHEVSMLYGVIVVLKGAYTCITTPDGNRYFNSTGNPGMATAGSGDVLTGIITSLLAQGYAPVSAAVLGVYLHGLAGDLAAHEVGQDGLISRDIVQYLPKAWQQIRSNGGQKEG